MRIYSAAGLAGRQGAELAATIRFPTTLRRVKYQIIRRIQGNVIAGDRIE
jgi:hypothetical protein